MVAAALGQPVSTESEYDTAEKVDILIELMGLEAFREKLTGELSTGTRRIVELACLLASDPAVIVLDEPSGGVAQRETEALGPLLQRVQAFTGASILVIEHDMPLLSSICDEMYALELGAIIAQGTPAEVLDHPRVIESYLGTDASAINRSGAGYRRLTMVDIAPRWNRLEHDERRGQILAAAAKLFAERHYASVSTKDIADAAGVARGLLHHYFGSKRDLYLEVAREMLRVPELPVLATDAAKGDDLWASSVDGWLDLMEANRDAWLAATRAGETGHDPQLREILDEASEVVVERVLEALGSTVGTRHLSCERSFAPTAGLRRKRRANGSSGAASTARKCACCSSV